MIISGGSRSNWRFFASHLMRTDENERVSVVELRGVLSEDVLEALREMDAVASGTRCKNFFYHANLNPRGDEHLTPEQWEQAADMLEKHLRLDGHARFIVEHEKEGRTHRHIIWSRIDPDTMTAVSDSFTARDHENASREIEAAFDLSTVESVLVKDRETERPERRPRNWETFRGHASGIDPQEVKAELTEIWHGADSGKAFQAAIEERGYILARGDRKDFCVIDPVGDEHSLARRIQGVKAAAIRERMSDIDREELPSVAEARELAHDRQDAAGDTAPADLHPGDWQAASEPERPGQLPQGDPALAEESHPAEPGLTAARHGAAGMPERVSGWGDAWRSFAERAAHYANQFYALLRDESGLSPHSWRSRVMDKAHGPDLPEPEGGDGGESARPGGAAASPAPEPAPQAGGEPLSDLFDAHSWATWEQVHEGYEQDMDDDWQEPDIDTGLDYDGPDLD